MKKYNLDLEIEESKNRFLTWLDNKVENEKSILNYLYYYNNLGLIFTSTKDYIPCGKPVIFSTCGFDEVGNWEQIWHKPEKYNVDWNPETQWNRYFIGIDPYKLEE